MTAGVSSAAIPQLQHVNCVDMISFYKFTEQLSRSTRLRTLWSSFRDKMDSAWCVKHQLPKGPLHEPIFVHSTEPSRFLFFMTISFHYDNSDSKKFLDKDLFARRSFLGGTTKKPTSTNNINGFISLFCLDIPFFWRSWTWVDIVIYCRPQNKINDNDAEWS